MNAAGYEKRPQLRAACALSLLFVGRHHRLLPPCWTSSFLADDRGGRVVAGRRVVATCVSSLLSPTASRRRPRFPPFFVLLVVVLPPCRSCSTRRQLDVSAHVFAVPVRLYSSPARSPSGRTRPGTAPGHVLRGFRTRGSLFRPWRRKMSGAGRTAAASHCSLSSPP